MTTPTFTPTATPMPDPEFAPTVTSITGSPGQTVDGGSSAILPVEFGGLPVTIGTVSTQG